MKRTLIILFALLLYTMPAAADMIQVDNVFSNTRKWLDERNLSITGGPSGSRDDLAAFSQEAILFMGEASGNPEHKSTAQREQMAKRAAVVMAQRSLVEYLEGFALVGDTLVKDGMAQYDLVSSAVSGFVKGSQVVFQEYSKEKDMAVAVIRIALHGAKGFNSLMYQRMLGDPKAREALKTDKPAFKVEPVKLDVVYDGLVIDATEQNFRPALINRIFSAKGEVLYDPAKVSQKVLVEQGCGEYTNSVDKAKAALGQRGVKNPLVVKASGSVNPSDLQVSDEDAAAIFSANQQGNFFSSAKVAFVLK